MTDQEPTVIFQAENQGGLDQGGSNRNGLPERPGNVLKVEQMRRAD